MSSTTNNSTNNSTKKTTTKIGADGYETHLLGAMIRNGTLADSKGMPYMKNRYASMDNRTLKSKMPPTKDSSSGSARQ